MCTTPRGQLGYFISCGSEAIYHIYSPKKHKVYRIGVTRVKDGEGLDDPYNTPCLEDRIPTRDIVAADRLFSGDEDGTSINRDNDYNVRSFLEESDSEPEYPTDVTGIQGTDDSNIEGTAPVTTSKYFNQGGHASIAKRKNADDTVVTVIRSRQATHGQGDTDQSDVSSEESNTNDDS
ncbi:hypothetical protein BJ875DRAFT_447234 [Amylocarpus encephaloides]|uniref:Uncharacterized protein n=1 Tax=Amylocarpus encephaloides TaxID=45428 RepID=A0A9P8BZE9_9HELO|nr:hypothetical protein BJ875DRAFT_447234 [Amylocarpus encephaloides]